MVNTLLVGLAVLWVICSPRVLWKFLQKKVFVFDEKSHGSQESFAALCRYLTQKQGFELLHPLVWGNGHHLNACLFKHPSSKLVFNFHMGRNNSMLSCVSFVRVFSQFGSVFVCEPPGFGESPGEADFLSFGNCGILSHRTLVQMGYSNDQIIPCGDSLGAAAATAEAVWAGSRALIISAAFESMVRMAREQMPILRIYPEWMFPSHTRLSNLENLRRFKGITLLLHGVHDELIPISHALALKAVAPARTILTELDAAHRDTAGSDPDTYKTAVEGFLRVWLSPSDIGLSSHPNGTADGAAASRVSDGDGSEPGLSLIVNPKPRPNRGKRGGLFGSHGLRLVVDGGKPVDSPHGGKSGKPSNDR